MHLVPTPPPDHELFTCPACPLDHELLPHPSPSFPHWSGIWVGLSPPTFRRNGGYCPIKAGWGYPDWDWMGNPSPPTPSELDGGTAPPIRNGWGSPLPIWTDGGTLTRSGLEDPLPPSGQDGAPSPSWNCKTPVGSDTRKEYNS